MTYDAVILRSTLENNFIFDCYNLKLKVGGLFINFLSSLVPTGK